MLSAKYSKMLRDWGTYWRRRAKARRRKGSAALSISSLLIRMKGKDKKTITDILIFIILIIVSSPNQSLLLQPQENHVAIINEQSHDTWKPTRGCPEELNVVGDTERRI
jgi:hypothetical protein